MTHIRIWNIEVFGRVEDRERSVLRKVAHWDKLESQKVLNVREMEDKVEALEEFKNWAVMEELTWRQKSREIWLKEGTKAQAFSAGRHFKGRQTHSNQGYDVKYAYLFSRCQRRWRPD